MIPTIKYERIVQTCTYPYPSAVQSQYSEVCTSLHLKGYFSTKYIKWYPLCTAGLSSAHEVLTADALQIYCSDTADGHG